MKFGADTLDLTTGGACTACTCKGCVHGHNNRNRYFVYIFGRSCTHYTEPCTKVTVSKCFFVYKILLPCTKYIIRVQNLVFCVQKHVYKIWISGKKFNFEGELGFKFYKKKNKSSLAQWADVQDFFFEDP